MPGDNVEMLCDLHFDVAAEVGTRYVAILPYQSFLMICGRFTLREGGKTSMCSFLIFLKSGLNFL